MKKITTNIAPVVAAEDAASHDFLMAEAYQIASQTLKRPPEKMSLSI